MTNGVIACYPVARRLWKPERPVATRPIAFRQYGKTATFLMHDGNKNVTDVITVGPANAPIAHYDYAPFGAATLSGIRASDNPFRFSSEFADDSLGLVYYNYRHYNPSAGRWFGRDPLEEYSRCYNPYQCCSNNLLKAFDCLGLRSQPCKPTFKYSLNLTDFILKDGLGEPILPYFTQDLGKYIESILPDVAEDSVSDYLLNRTVPEVADIVKRVLNQTAIHKKLFTSAQWIDTVIIQADLKMQWISCCENDKEEQTKIRVEERPFIHMYTPSDYKKIDAIIESFNDQVDCCIEEFERRVGK